MSIADQLDEAAREGRFVSLMLVHSSIGWQASLQAKRGVNSYRVEVRPTPSAAIAAVLSRPGPPEPEGVFG